MVPAAAIDARVQATAAFDEDRCALLLESDHRAVAWADGDAGVRSFELPFGLPENMASPRLNLDGPLFPEGHRQRPSSRSSSRPTNEFVLTSNGDQPELTQSPFGWQVAVWSAPDEDGQGVFVQVFDEFGQPVNAARFA